MILLPSNQAATYDEGLAHEKQVGLEQLKAGI